MTGSTETEWVDRLVSLGRTVRDTVIRASARGSDLATPVAQEGGDTIFAVDRHVEPVIENAITSWGVPLTLIAEGMGEDGVKHFGLDSRYRLIMDPIDGTRNIMYDKRSAWFLAAVAEDRGPQTTVADAFVSVLMELPTSKAGYADVVSASADCVVCARESLHDHSTHAVPIQPSRAATLRNGFAQVASFFPGTKVYAAELMERIVRETLGDIEPGVAAVFDDQYITTGGQFVELLMGRDRFCCDLRPLFYEIIGGKTGNKIRGLECHPYDVAGLLAAEASGVIITDGLGRPLRPPMDVHSPVHWCGYANEQLRLQIAPIITGYFSEHGVTPS